MGIVKAAKLVYEYIRRDEEENIEEVKRAIDGVDVDIKKGDFVAVLGHNGSGKSTLAKHVNGLLLPTEGTVWVGDMDTRDEEHIWDVRKTAGMVFQNPDNQIIGNIVEEDVGFGPENIGVPTEEIWKRVEASLKAVGMTAYRLQSPNKLSGGQKQRVAIARAIATNPKVLLCDEATSALDPNTTKAILQLLKEINQSMGITVVIITHEMAVIEAVCDRVAIIDKSHIAEIGEVSRVFAEPKSKIGRQLILGDAAEKVEFGTGRLFRIIFDGLASSEPVISNVVLACKVPVNIMYAATRDIKGKAAGQMIIELPDHEPDIERVLQYLDRAKVPYEEVGKNEL